jgi:ectoine hydroxylase-related dioxygenase (phytanoyl-CoA dioxygenase family)
VTRSEYARRFVADEVFVGLARDLIGPDVRLYWDQSVFKQPHGAEPVLWHQDNGYTYVEPQAYLTCWVAITDATPENGCIAVMPGVHRDGTLEHRNTPVGEECWGDWSAAVEVPVRAGSIVVFTSLTPHATRRNTTDAVRKAYIVQYAPDGAVAHFGDPASGPPAKTEVLGDDERRYWIVRDGARVEPEMSR